MEDGKDKIDKWLGWHRHSFMHTFAHVTGTLLPFIIVFIVCIFSERGNVWEFLKDGDFCLFSAAILTPAAYSFASYKGEKEDLKASKYKLIAENMWMISIGLIGVSSILFLLIYIHSIDCSLSIHADAIVVISILFLLASFFIYYISRFIERDIEFDINELEEEDYEKFEANYRNKKKK